MKPVDLAHILPAAPFSCCIIGAEIELCSRSRSPSRQECSETRCFTALCKLNKTTRPRSGVSGSGIRSGQLVRSGNTQFFKKKFPKRTEPNIGLLRILRKSPSGANGQKRKQVAESGFVLAFALISPLLSALIGPHRWPEASQSVPVPLQTRHVSTYAVLRPAPTPIRRQSLHQRRQRRVAWPTRRRAAGATLSH
jgi:hypothetical protein